MSVSGKFSDVVYQRRTSYHLTQKEVAEYSGISIRHYQDLEMGRSSPSLATALRLAVVLDFSLDLFKSEVAEFVLPLSRL